MKSILTLAIFLKATISFSQLALGGLEGIKDTSNYPELRSKIEFQNFFIKIDSTDVSAYFARAALEYQLGNFKTCISQQNEILKRFPNYAADAYTNRGMCYCFLKQYNLALSDLSIAKSLSPTDPKSFLNLAFAYSGLEEFKRAILYLDTAILLKTTYAKAYVNRGFAKGQLENFKGALLDYNKALEIQPSYAEVYFNRAYIEFKLGNLESAIKDYNMALQLLPALSKSSDFYIYRGKVYEKMGDTGKAKLDFATAEKLR